MHSTMLLIGFVAAIASTAACGGSPPRSPTGPTAGGTTSQVAVAGTVSDAAWRPLPGARIEVTGGPGAGLAAIANGAGGFTLVGPFDSTSRFQATRDGHVAATLALPVRCDACNPPHWLHFYLAANDTPVDIAGSYELTFFADPSCAALPAMARTRTYRATVAPSVRADDPANSRFEVVVTGPPLLSRYDRFTIGVVGQYLMTDIGDWGHGGAGLVEAVADNTYVTLGGEFTATVGNRMLIEGAMFGSFDYCTLSTEWQTRASCRDDAVETHAACLSKNHRLSLRRLD